MDTSTTQSDEAISTPTNKPKLLKKIAFLILGLICIFFVVKFIGPIKIMVKKSDPDFGGCDNLDYQVVY